MDNLPNLLRFPNKRQRRSAQRKLFSWYTIHEAICVVLALATYDFLLWVFKSIVGLF